MYVLKQKCKPKLFNSVPRGPCPAEFIATLINHEPFNQGLQNYWKSTGRCVWLQLEIKSSGQELDSSALKLLEWSSTLGNRQLNLCSKYWQALLVPTHCSKSRNRCFVLHQIRWWMPVGWMLCPHPKPSAALNSIHGCTLASCQFIGFKSVIGNL